MHFRLLDALNLNIVHWLHSRTLALFCYTFYTAQVCVKIRSGAMERNILEQFPLHLILAGPKWWDLVEKVTRLPSRVKNPDR